MAGIVGGTILVADPQTAPWLFGLGVLGAASYAGAMRLLYPDVTATHLRRVADALGRQAPR